VRAGPPRVLVLGRDNNTGEYGCVCKSRPHNHPVTSNCQTNPQPGLASNQQQEGILHIFLHLTTVSYHLLLSSISTSTSNKHNNSSRLKQHDSGRRLHSVASLESVLT
jgi:hypothetical protein